MSNSHWRSTHCMPLDNTPPSALSFCIFITGTKAFHASTWWVIEEPSFRLGQGAECCRLPLQRVLKPKYSQHQPCRHHHMSLLPCSRLESRSWSYLFTGTQTPVHHLSLRGCGTSTQSQPSFLAAISFALPLFPVQLISCSQIFAATVCLLLCPVNSLWPWEQFLTQLAAHVCFSLNFGSCLNWIFRQHPGEHSWESTFIHLEDAYGIASQLAFCQGKLRPMSLLKHRPSPSSTAPPQISPIYTTASPNTFFQGTQPEQSQRRSAKWLVQGKPIPNYTRPQLTGNGILWSLSFLLNLSEHLKYFCQLEPVEHRVLVPEFVQKTSKYCEVARRATWIPPVS